MDTFGLKIIASDRVFYEGRCRKLVIPAPDGEKGILPNHENMVIAVKIGMARMEIEEGNWVEVALGRGFAEVVNNRVTLLVDTAEKPEEIDIRHAQEHRAWQNIALFPEWNCDVPIYLANHHRGFMHEWLRYQAFYLMEYWRMKHGEDMLGLPH